MVANSSAGLDEASPWSLGVVTSTGYGARQELHAQCLRTTGDPAAAPLASMQPTRRKNRWREDAGGLCRWESGLIKSAPSRDRCLVDYPRHERNAKLCRTKNLPERTKWWAGADRSLPGWLNAAGTCVNSAHTCLVPDLVRIVARPADYPQPRQPHRFAASRRSGMITGITASPVPRPAAITSPARSHHVCGRSSVPVPTTAASGNGSWSGG